MFKNKILSLLVALIATTALWASNTITYKANYKLSETNYGLGLHVNAFNVAISSHTFSNGTGAITFSGEVTTIGDEAFYFCEGLKSVTIPSSVTTIGDEAFEYCRGLTSITIPNSVTTIGDDAFSSCRGLTSVTIGNSVTTIGNHAFYLCEGLKSVTIPNSVTTIGDEAFSLCSGLTSVTIGNSVTTIGDDAFEYCRGLTSVTIPNSVTTIGSFAFSGCSGLTSITIPNSVTTIGDRAFEYVNNIVYGGTAIGSPWGAKCVNGFVDGYWVYSDATKTKLCGCSSSATGAITIPNSVTTIGDDAFYGCRGLKYVTIPNSVTTIGSSAFSDCDGLTSVTIGNSVTTIGNHAFLGCSGLTSITIPNYVTTIGIGAFYDCASIEKVYVSSYPFEIGINSVITLAINAYASTTPQYILQILAPISTDRATPTCAFVYVDLSKMETSQYAKMALDFAGTKYELSTKESTVILTGLTPASTNQATFYSQLVGESQWREGATIEVTTPALTLTILTPKVVSAGTAIVAAETNISDYETNVGFEWRKYDAPSTMPSKSGAAILYNGMMEGKLLNLGTDSYWNVRPYYEAADGARYYGNWITFDPGDFSYFEPTVHTYALATSPISNSVQVRGYVMTGTDEVTEQGFEYWINSAKAPNRVSSATSEDVHRVKASGQLMSAVLENLAYSSTYTCRAYAIAGAKTYYGEEVQFLTPENPTGLFDVFMNNDAQRATKFMHNGQLYILRDGNLYTATGAKVK